MHTRPASGNHALKALLDGLYDRYATDGRISSDPVGLPHMYTRPADIEAAALVAASFAYGRVDLFKPVALGVLRALGDRPHDALLDFDAAMFCRENSGISYRFQKNPDIAGYLSLVSLALRKHGGLKKLFFSAAGTTVQERLSGMVRGILDGWDGKPPAGVAQLLPDPATGSACKRMYMFLRWMVRRDEVDFGLWAEYGAHNLVIPVDTHVARISQKLGLTARRSADYRMAVEITGNLRAFCPADPVRYDFAIAHLGISGDCPSRHDAKRCAGCDLFGVCSG
ncbi:MAG: TIGR02757 family protein [Myxococcota bacterium]|jgi:uncharacterized protein (TIGR02757 family)